MQRILLLIFLGMPFWSLAQNQLNTTAVDSLYREDQFYIGANYNFLFNKPSGVTQRNLSYGLSMGFIRDIPLNRSRNVGLGIGLGYSLDTYYTNLLASETGQGTVYSILEGGTFKRNKLEYHLVQIPLEFRWRTSTPTDFKFWRIYTGVVVGYVFASRSKFVSNTEKIGFSNGDSRNFQYGLSFNFGYGTWNIHLYYALNPLLNDGVVTDKGEAIKMKPLQLGLVFYIL
ncbi:PorT family protein [Flavobacteriaceae bacterium F89]|uniref:PorT family protein n=1 Tax=Cerina litoralis TaxID=2874477 RepID=A0AAE3EVU2_9FLAO|nr:porin family protein [Cerina litoralis]MCG2461530.1 PorT family protein [Cerina litoralis]